MKALRTTRPGRPARPDPVGQPGGDLAGAPAIGVGQALVAVAEQVGAGPPQAGEQAILGRRHAARPSRRPGYGRRQSRAPPARGRPAGSGGNRAARARRTSGTARWCRISRDDAVEAGAEIGGLAPSPRSRRRRRNRARGRSAGRRACRRSRCRRFPGFAGDPPAARLENHGNRRENGTDRTSAMAVTPAVFSRPRNWSAGRLE